MYGIIKPVTFRKLAHMACDAVALVGLGILLTGCAKTETAHMVGTNEEEKTTETTPAETTTPQPSTVVVETSKGSFEITLWEDKAPTTVSNFLAYVDDDYYTDLIFHRVIKGFMIQGGGFDTAMHQKKTGAQIKNEASKEAPNARGTIAMARTSNINSATSQFFINLSDNDFLNHKDTTARGFGYCVFGEVTAGMDVVEAIEKVATGRHGMHADVPIEAVVIKDIRRK